MAIWNWREKMKHLFAALCIFSILSSCSNKNVTPEPVVKIVHIETKRPPLIVPEPDVISLKKVHWNIITKSNSNVKLEENGGVLYGLSEIDYKDMSKSTTLLRILIEEQKAIILKYKKYYAN